MVFVAPRDLTHAIRSFPMLIDGAEVGDGGRRIFARRSPAHDVEVTRYPGATPDDLDRSLAAARRAFDRGPWSRASGAERARVLHRVADLIEQNQEELALLDTLEAGKPIVQARGEIANAADFWRYAAGLARNLHGEAHNTFGPGTACMVMREPIGVVAMITAWNFPFVLVAQKLPFALAAGCTVVLKPSEMTSASTLMLGSLLTQAGLPPGVVNIVVGEGHDVGGTLISDPRVDMVSFTGSTRVGRTVVESSAKTIKKVALELGGKNALIACADCELDLAVDAALHGFLFNAGQCCQASSRILVQDSIAEVFTHCLCEAADAVVHGDPLDERVRFGAIVSQAQLGRIEAYVAEARRDGITAALPGGRAEAAAGNFYHPTVFSPVAPGARISTEEVFGPVVSIIPFRDVPEAITIANSTSYGLSGAIWTADLDKAFEAATQIRAGSVWINAWMDGFPEVPFGGFKESGLGREGGSAAVEEFTEMKSIVVRYGSRRAKWMPGVKDHATPVQAS